VPRAFGAPVESVVTISTIAGSVVATISGIESALRRRLQEDQQRKNQTAAQIFGHLRQRSPVACLFEIKWRQPTFACPHEFVTLAVVQ
jgi:hypothetical protein